MNTNAPSVITTFYLRSSLTGQVIAEYDATGVRQKTYVYAGRTLLVQGSRVTDQVTQLRWQQINPLTGDGLQTDAQGNTLERTTVDPMGVNVGDTDPFVANEPTNGGDGEGMSQSAIDSMVAALIPGWGGPKCAIDGMITGCNLVSGMLASGAAEECLDGNCGTQQVTIIGRNSAGKIVGQTTIDVLPGQPGWNGHLDGFYSVLNTQPISFDGSAGFAAAFLRNAADPGRSGVFEAGDGAFQLSSPQKSSQSSETGECAGIRGQLVGNPFNAAALDAVWQRSQQTVKHEEGGLLGYTYGGGPVDSVFTAKSVGSTTSLEGFTTWAQKKISAGHGFVTYTFWYHAHPHDKGEVLPNGDKVGEVDFPSYDDQQVSGHVGLLGILVSRQRIVVFDKQGFIKCYFDR